MPESCISIGSNLSDPKQQIINAFERIELLPSTQLIKQSRAFENEPWGNTDQPRFINAVVLIETTLSPIELLDALQEIEHQTGRIREEKWGPRTLDLDIICYGNKAMRSPRLILPHPLFSEREFVLLPLVEIYPECMISGRSASEWLTILQTPNPPIF